MNFRDIKTYLFFALLLGAGYVMTSCQREEDLFQEKTGVPVNFSVDSQTPNSTKANSILIDGVSDLKDDGIVVWANWEAVNPAQSQSGAFGDYGTKVYYTPDASGNQGWSYSPVRYWYHADYTFASAAPASLFTAECVKDGDNNNNGCATGELSGSKLEITFENGFDLKGNQQDFLVAFTTVDKSAENSDLSESVNIVLNHQLSLINLNAASTETNASIEITKVTISGNHAKATAATFTCTDSGITNAWTFDDAPDEYFSKDINSGALTATSINLFSNLLVFPEESSVTITLTCNEKHKVSDSEFGGSVTGVPKSLTFDAAWKAGKVYTYNLNVTNNSILIGEPTVTDWVEGGALGDDVTM